MATVNCFLIGYFLADKKDRLKKQNTKKKGLFFGIFLQHFKWRLQKMLPIPDHKICQKSITFEYWSNLLCNLFTTFNTLWIGVDKKQFPEMKITGILSNCPLCFPEGKKNWQNFSHKSSFLSIIGKFKKNQLTAPPPCFFRKMTGRRRAVRWN